MFDLHSYLAGLFDGEGCVSLQHKSQYHHRRAYTRLLVSVGMRTPEPLMLFKQEFGGSIKKYGHIYQWYVCGATAALALEVFGRLCVVKREQAQLASRATVLLAKEKVRGRRPSGSQIMSDADLAERIDLAQRVTALKRYADA